MTGMYNGGMRNFERDIFENLTIDQMSAKAERVIRKDEIRPDEFSYLYGKENVENDMKYVSDMEAKFENQASPEQKRARRLAEVFEAVVHEQGELSEWFGPDAETIKTSRFDDIKNGVDNIVEFREKNRSASHVAFAIDVTFSNEMDKKFDRIRKEIDDGELAKVKYFYSEYLGIRGELTKIPRFVVGAESKTVKEIGELWIEGKKKELGNHWVQFQILEEIIEQADAFAEYADRYGKHDVAEAYRRVERYFRDINKTKMSELKDNGERDNAYYSIGSIANGFRNTEKP